MRSRLHGTFATLLLMVPVLLIPALAIFGIPQFAPVVASPLDEDDSGSDRERRVGKSARPNADGFPDDLDEATAFGGEADRTGEQPPGRLGESVPLKRRGQPAKPDQLPRWQNNGFEDQRITQDPTTNSGQRFETPADDSGLPDDSTPKRNRPRTLAQPRPQNDFSGQVGETGPHEPTTEPLTWQAAIRRLKDMEIRNFRLQPGHDENQFVFICSYTPRNSPLVSYRFEAEADDPLKAVEKVLAQVTEWRQKRQ